MLVIVVVQLLVGSACVTSLQQPQMILTGFDAAIRSAPL